MATTWTDATLYTDSEAFNDLPSLLSDNFVLTTDSGTYYLETDVKKRIEEMILNNFNDFPQFDIEEITTASITDILKPIALQLNSALVARFTSKDQSDAYFGLWDDFHADVLARMRRIMKRTGLQYNDPDGINERKFQTVPIIR